MKPRIIETRIRVPNVPHTHSAAAGVPVVQLVRIGILKPSPRNARTHSKKQIRQIANSILRFKWTYPILVDEDEIIIAGHGRYLAALELGLKQVPVIVMAGLSSLRNGGR